MNGWPAGTPIPNTEFEIYNARTGKLVDTIRTGKNGVAVSKPLPLARYEVIESQAADFYGLDKTPIEVEIEYAGQIVKAVMTNKSLYTNVAIQKTGYAEVMPDQNIRYSFSGHRQQLHDFSHIVLLARYPARGGGPSGEDHHRHLQCRWKL